ATVTKYDGVSASRDPCSRCTAPKKNGGVSSAAAMMLIAPKRRSQQSNPIDRRRVQGRLPGGCIGDHGLDRAVADLRHQEFGVAHLEGVVLDQDVLVFDRTVAALISHLPAKSLHVGHREGTLLARRIGPLPGPLPLRGIDWDILRMRPRRRGLGRVAGCKSA